MEQCPELIKILLSFPNIDVNIKNKLGETPLHYALIGYNQNINVLIELLRYGGDIFIKNNKNHTPFLNAMLFFNNDYNKFIYNFR